MLVLGHRGSPRRFSENTLLSFEAALAAGADGVELDVRLTADGVLVIRHDETLGDATAISTITAQQLHSIDRSIPTLQQAIQTLTSARRIVVEAKPQGARTELVADLLAAELEQADTSRIVVSSFDAKLVRALRDRSPRIATALLTGLVRSEEDVRWLVEEARSAGHDEVHVERRSVLGPVGGSILAACVDARVKVAAWTVNELSEARRLRDLGVSSVITDVPEQIVGQA